MRNILARANREVLQQFVWSKVLLAFDYDGTLSPIVGKPEQATMRPTTRRLLAELTRLYPCIVISGRTQTDTLRRLRNVGVLRVIGNHGLEPWGATTKIREEVQGWHPLLDDRLAALPGVRIEDKIFSIAVHYRQSREKKKARAAILRTVRSLGGVRLLGGKQVVNILPRGAPHKGIALEKERTRLHCDTAIYIGDDETDEDVFALDQTGQLLTIRVGQKHASAASYFIKNQKDMDTLMRVLLQLRQQMTVAEPFRGDRQRALGR